MLFILNTKYNATVRVSFKSKVNVWTGITHA